MGTIFDRSWIGIHTLKIRSTNGRLTNDPLARGRNGLFNSVLSKPLTISIVDPCLNSIVNSDSSLRLNEMIVQEGSDLLVVGYKGPKDSASIKYGNGYDKCGSLTYEWFDTKMQRKFDNPYFSFDFAIAER